MNPQKELVRIEKFKDIKNFYSQQQVQSSRGSGSNTNYKQSVVIPFLNQKLVTKPTLWKK